MRIKILELRDKSTFIPIMAIDMLADNELQRWLLRRAGYNADEPHAIFVARCHGGKGACDPYEWGDRTFAAAHQYIQDYWPMLEDGDVVDVEFILGETKKPKRTERE